MSRYKKFLTIVILAAGSLYMHMQVHAEPAPTGTGWILIEESPNLDRSTKFLFNGHYQAGIRYANKALGRNSSPLVQIIGQYNLCLAYALTGESDLAAPHCRKAIDLEKPRIYLRMIKRGLYKIGRQGRDDEHIPELGNVIKDNLASRQVVLDAAQYAESIQDATSHQVN